MPVLHRRICASRFHGQSVLGAVATDKGDLVAFSRDVDVSALAELDLSRDGRDIFAHLPPGVVEDVASPELDLFEDKRVLLALRNGETAQAAANWVRHHSGLCSGFVMFNRAQPGTDRFAGDLAALLEAFDGTVLVVDADTPLGRNGGADARDPSFAPAVRPFQAVARVDPWHAPLAEMSLYELLRHRFLNRAKSIALLDISDTLSPASDAFELAEQNPGQLIQLIGTEIYPWRLRQGRPAHHLDHIAKRRDENRKLLSWCAAAAAMPHECLWTPGRPLNMPKAKFERPFLRAMGIVYPGAPMESIVKKSDLVEDAKLVARAKAAGYKPVRLPARQSPPPRPENGTVTIVSVMKNEGPFILDWIAHNRAIGIDRHLIYTNDCDDGTDHLLDLLADAGVTRCDNPFRETGQVPQHAAFRAAQSEASVTSADWLLTLDVDEYINIHAGDGTVHELMDAVPDAHVISMPWRLFGSGDRLAFEDKPVTEQFTHAAPAFMPRPYQAWAFKSLYRNDGFFRRMGVHRPKGVNPAFHDEICWVTGSGKPMARSVWESAWRVGQANWGYDLVTLNHYAVRSAESFLIKRDRGRVNHVHREQGEAYWFRMNHNVEEELSIQRLATRTAKVKAELLSLPGVAEAHARAVAWHRQRIEELKAQPAMRAFFDQITSARMQKLSRYGPHFGMKVFMEGPHVVPDEVLELEPGGNFYVTPGLLKTTR